MKYYTLAGGALAVPAIILGTADFGAAVPQPEAFAMLDCYAASGGTLLDTAHVYGQWIPGGRSLSEELIGRWLKGRGQDGGIQIATKGAHPLLDDGTGRMGPPRLAPEHGYAPGAAASGEAPLPGRFQLAHRPAQGGQRIRRPLRV